MSGIRSISISKYPASNFDRVSETLSRILLRGSDTGGQDIKFSAFQNNIINNDTNLLRLPSVLGVPTGIILESEEGSVVWDTDNKKLYIWNGTDWEIINNDFLTPNLFEVLTEGNETQGENILFDGFQSSSITSATNYLRLPSVTGNPTGTPLGNATAEGAVLWDTVNKKLNIWDGTAWEIINDTQATPTLEQVLNEGNVASTDIEMSGTSAIRFTNTTADCLIKSEPSDFLISAQGGTSRLLLDSQADAIITASTNINLQSQDISCESVNNISLVASNQLSINADGLLIVEGLGVTFTSNTNMTISSTVLNLNAPSYTVTDGAVNKIIADTENIVLGDTDFSLIYGSISSSTDTSLIPVNSMCHFITTTMPGQVVSLDNEIRTGRQLVVIYESGSDPVDLVPTTLIGATTITFNALGDTVTLLNKSGWFIIGSRGVTIT